MQPQDNTTFVTQGLDSSLCLCIQISIIQIQQIGMSDTVALPLQRKPFTNDFKPLLGHRHDVRGELLHSRVPDAGEAEDLLQQPHDLVLQKAIARKYNCSLFLG